MRYKFPDTQFNRDSSFRLGKDMPQAATFLLLCVRFMHFIKRIYGMYEIKIKTNEVCNITNNWEPYVLRAGVHHTVLVCCKHNSISGVSITVMISHILLVIDGRKPRFRLDWSLPPLQALLVSQYTQLCKLVCPFVSSRKPLN
jgi:hypothetical protein